MKEVEEELYKSLRDDDDPNDGIPALLGNTSTAPYNVYHSHLPESVDFRQDDDHSFITYFLVSSIGDQDQHDRSGTTLEQLYQFTVWSRCLSKMHDIHARIKLRLNRKWKVSDPTENAVIHQVRFEADGPETWDDDFKVFTKPATYRVWVRDDNIG